jgi:uncharacterized protein YecT (DUF1311 family)
MLLFFSEIIMLRLLATFALVWFACHAHAASFDCTKARAEDERAICKNAELSKLDEDMAAAYKAAIQPIGGDKLRLNPLRANQLEWVKDRVRCGDSLPCLKENYVQRIAWLKSPLLPFTGLWVNKKYRVIIVMEDDTLKPIVRVFAGPGEAGFMAMELQSRFVAAVNNPQEGTEAVQITPQFQPAFRQYEGQCSAISINFFKDDEAYLASNGPCPLFKTESDRGLLLKEAMYPFTRKK